VNLEILRGAAAVLPWSAWARESLIADYGVAAECIEVIPPGVDLSLWAPATQRRPGPLRILFVGGDFYRKGGATLLQVFRALPSGSAELHVVTKTELQPENGLHMYYELQPNSPGLIARYQASDVFVLPSEAEAFGIAAVEACASGLALIATAMGGLTDIVEEGKTGFLIPPQSPAALCERLQRLVNNPVLLAEMGRAARVRAEERFSAQRNTARIIEHLRQAAGGATSP
jgi:glycosyltransferase involved in cell wall biosynthesis